ncbi:MAG: Lrp/AsnC ligand binding domain-containing protein [Pseudonocardiaceae bacterium]
MVEAYILIQASSGELHRVAANLAKLPAVLEARAVMGPYDVIAFVRVADAHALGTFISTQLQPMEGIMRTLTCSVIESAVG